MILSLDLASRQSGWSLHGNKGELVDYGIIAPRPIRLTAEERLPIIEAAIEKILNEYPVTHCVLENPAGGAEDSRGPDKNWLTLFVLAMTHGVVRNVLEKRKITYNIISPSTWQNRLGFFKRDRAGRKAAAKKYAMEKYNVGEQEQDIYDALCLYDAHIYLEEFSAQAKQSEVSAF